ncbi:Cyb5 protein [Pichia kluyveri]|uniref:Cyb5 protein n=1 Tax=Pichia kluyveri TaxID=36015 RepID=A0AAV5R5Q0_PICKL|nr:Cyb5 protein [Pichia kluyveri]
MSAKTYTFEQVQEHKSRDDIWIIYKNKVYDVTNYLDEHPGGEEVILDCAGDDATDAFDDIGHSDDAVEMLNGLFIGDLIGGIKGKSGDTLNKTSNGDSNIVLLGAVTVAIAIIAYFVLNK